MTQKNTSSTASRKGGVFNFKKEVDQIIDTMELYGVEFPQWVSDRDVKDAIETSLRRAYRNGRLDAILDKMRAEERIRKELNL